MAIDDSINLDLNQQANRFTLTDSEGLTRIVFLPNLSLISNTQPPLPQLRYRGTEGELIFTGDDIEQQQSRLGQLVTVVLDPNLKTGQLVFTLILPPIELAGQIERDFITIAIKTKSPGSHASLAGAALTYEGFALRGLAEVISRKNEE